MFFGRLAFLSCLIAAGVLSNLGFLTIKSWAIVIITLTFVSSAGFLVYVAARHDHETAAAAKSAAAWADHHATAHPTGADPTSEPRSGWRLGSIIALDKAHLIERYGLLIILLLGESVSVHHIGWHEQETRSVNSAHSSGRFF
jgi:hypothetical protein